MKGVRAGIAIAVIVSALGLGLLVTGCEVSDSEIIEDISLTSETSVDIVVPLSGHELLDVLRGRLYIKEDPGSAFYQTVVFTFYSRERMKGEDALFRSRGYLVYDELEDATTGADTDITPDNHRLFTPNNLVMFLDNNELSRIDTVADTMTAEDIVGVHPVDTGLVRVIEFSGFTLYNAEDGDEVYLRISFESAQTVDLQIAILTKGGI